MNPFQDLLDSETLHEVCDIEKKSGHEIEIKTHLDSTVTPFHWKVSWFGKNDYDVFNELTQSWVDRELTRGQVYDLIQSMIES